LRALPGASGIDTWKSLASPIWLRLARTRWFPHSPSLQSLAEIPQGCLLVALHQPFAGVNVPPWQALIRYALRCTPPDLPIVIRPHPAEWPPAGANDEFGGVLSGRRVFVSRVGTGPHLHALFERSRAVLTIRSAVGAEALAYGVPVLTLATAFYCRAGCGRLVREADIEELRRALADDSVARPDEGQVAALIATIVAHHMIDEPHRHGQGAQDLAYRIRALVRLRDAVRPSAAQLNCH
jgi:hypothetical protein